MSGRTGGQAVHIADTLMIALFFAVTTASGGATLWLWRAEYVHQRAVSFRVPSIYWPLARLGFSRHRTARSIFRFFFCELYRKRFWNPLINSWAKVGTFNRRRHLSNYNIHAASSVMFLVMFLFFVYFAWRTAALPPSGISHCFCVWAAIALLIECVFNLPAIVLSRYLYLVTLRRPGLKQSLDVRPPQKGPESPARRN